jgi:hypothetical protein
MSEPISYSIDPELAPYVKELEFAADSYAYGLQVLGVPYATIDVTSVRFAGGIGQPGLYTIGSSTITLWPRTIDTCPPGEFDELYHVAPELTAQSKTQLDLAHNYILLHETGHLVDFANREPTGEHARLSEALDAVSKMQGATRSGAAVGAVIGSGLSSELTTLRPWAGAIMGAISLSVAARGLSQLNQREAIDRIWQDYKDAEAKADAMCQDLAAIALLGNIVHIELRKRPARNFAISSK